MEELDPVAQYFTAKLTGIDDQVGESVHAEALEDGASYPAFRFAFFGGPRVIGNGGEVYAGEPLFLVCVHGRNDILSPAELGVIAAKIGPAVDNSQEGPTQVGDYVISCWADPRGPYRDYGFEDGMRYDAIGAYYRVFVQPGTGGNPLP